MDDDKDEDDEVVVSDVHLRQSARGGTPSLWQCYNWYCKTVIPLFSVPVSAFWQTFVIMKIIDDD